MIRLLLFFSFTRENINLKSHSIINSKLFKIIIIFEHYCIIVNWFIHFINHYYFFFIYIDRQKSLMCN